MNKAQQNYWAHKVIVITGASGGIGKALALECLSYGARVAVCARNMEKLTSAYSSYSEDKVFAYQCDVSQEKACEDFIQAAYSHFGQINILINNAGMSMRSLFRDVDIAVLKQLMDVNLWGTIYCTKYALPHIQKQNGTVVGVSSIAGYRGLPARSGYSSSKFAMQGFLESLRTELLHSGTQIMWVCPGFTSSEIRNTALNAEGNVQQESPLDENKLMSAEECARRILRAVYKKKRTLVLTPKGKLTVWLNKMLPSLTDKLVYNHFQKEEGSPLS